MSNIIKAHSTIGSVSKVTESGYANIGGVWKPITEVYTNIGGVWKSAWEAGTTLVSSLAVGSSVFMNVNGVSTEFIIVHQGRPSTTYDSSCNGTWLLMKDVYEKRAFDSTDNDYGNSDIHSYMNNTFISLFDSGIQSAIKQVKIPYTQGVGKGGSVMKGSSGLSAKIFLLSYTEVGYSKVSTTNVEGTVLSYFKGALDSKRIAYLNGSASNWWLRSPGNTSTESSYRIDKNGAADWIPGSSTAIGLRPACIIDSSMIVDENNIIIV